MAPVLSSSSGVQVVVRLRPLNEKEKKHGTLPVVSASTNDRSVTVIKGTGSRQSRNMFSFDNVFTSFSTQQEVFDETMKPIIRDVLTGYESTVFAYGQTGTGKTHTMEGSLDHQDNYGVIPRAAEAIFDRLNREDLKYESYQVYCSYLEIYNEELCDLLVDDSNPNCNSPRRGGATAALAIMEGPQGPFCRNLSETQVFNASDLLDLMQKAQLQRKVGETNMNKQSSRSHCIFTLRVEAKRRLEDGALFESRGKLHMVDLAGSECAKTANLDNRDKAQLARERERMNINRSLLTLGRVVQMLKEQSKKGSKAGNVRIPYRDSKLTRILQQALGGNSKTVIICTLSPSVTAIEESMSTLNYAQAAHGIVNKPVSASFLSQATGASTMLSGKDASCSGQVGTIEKWTEMETRLEYMQSQVEEAKAALARKHLQQQELVERAETAETERAKLEQQAQDLTTKNAMLKEDLAQVQDNLEKTEHQLTETTAELEKTTVVLHATQETEVKLTTEARDLIEAVKRSVADGDNLYRMILTNRDADLKRRQAAKQFNSSVISLLSDVKETLKQISQKESNHQQQTDQLADKSYEGEMAFLEKTKEVLQAAVQSVATAVETLKCSIHEEDGIVPTTDALVQSASAKISNIHSIIDEGEQNLVANFNSTRQQLAAFGAQVVTLETTHRESTERALAALEDNATTSKRKIQELVTSTSTALEAATQIRKRVRNATKATVEQWKDSMINNGDNIFQQSTTQRNAVQETLETMNVEMQRHTNIETTLQRQSALLRDSHSMSALTHESQKELLLQTKASVQQSHDNQTQILKSFVANVMKGVEAIVEKQVSDVMTEASKGHFEFLQNSNTLAENHSSITASTLETLTTATDFTASVQQEATAAKQNDVSAIQHLEETHSAFGQIQDTVNLHKANVQDFASQTFQHLEESEALESEDEVVRGRLSSEGNECSQFISDRLLTDTKDQVSGLGAAGSAISELVRNDVLVSMNRAVDDLEEPRNEVMEGFSAECAAIDDSFKKGLATIREKATISSRISEELHGGVEKAAYDFSNSVAIKRVSEITKAQEQFKSLACEHATNSKQQIDTSNEGVQSVASTMNVFVKHDLLAYAEVENVPDRMETNYSEQLSFTPSENEILQGAKKVGSVLKNISPNQPPIATKKSHKGGVGHLVQNLPHERREPRSECLS